jgi:hypothetical protein
VEPKTRGTAVSLTGDLDANGTAFSGEPTNAFKKHQLRLVFLFAAIVLSCPKLLKPATRDMKKSNMRSLQAV